MSSSDKELEEQLAEAGNKLLQPPSSLDELLPLLDQVESSLSRVEQSPAKSMHDALSPLMKALVADELLMHSDADVKVFVASCISEITRITAPDAPYDDDKMKDVFQLIVSSFENLHDKCSRSYSKRAMILETVAKVRSCVVMLDLECDRLITEMFQHFLQAIRDDHPESIFSSMETIMTLVLEESEDVSLELLTPLLASVKKNNEEVTPIAKKLGETVFANCASKLKPYLAQAVKSLDLSLEEYSKILASVLEGTHVAVEHSNDSASKDQFAAESKLADLPEGAQATQGDGSKVATTSSDDAGQMAESIREEACSEGGDPAVNRSPKSITSNGVIVTNGGCVAETECLMKAGDPQDDAKMMSKSDSDDSRAEKSMKSESRSELATKKSVRKAKSSDQAPDDNEKEAEKRPDRRKNQNKDVESNTSEDTIVEESNSLEKETQTTPQHSIQKESEGEDVNVAPTSPSQSLADESVPKKVGRPKKKGSSSKKENVSKNVSEVSSDIETKQVNRPSKKAPLVPSYEEKGGSTSDAEAKKPMQSGKKSEPKVKSQDGPSTNKKESGKKRGRGKANLERAPSLDSPDKSAKDEVEEILRTSAKRRLTSGKDRETEAVQYDESLVDSKVKVWWPDDHAFYKGVITAFDAIKKKHTVLYNDGDEEVLHLKKERWEFVQDDEMSEEEQAASPDASTEVQKKKKAKTIAEPSAKKEKVEASPKSKAKGKSTKSGRKSKDDDKVEFNLKEGTSKSDGRTEDVADSKSKAQSHKSTGKSNDDTGKASARSKDVDSSTPKSKQETSKAATKSKGKTPQSGIKPNDNGTGKAKSSSTKVKESGAQKEKTTEPAKTPDSAKGKLSGESKDPVSGKKRGRGKR